ncbi:hypothetical protein EV122DRAFT_282579 [Schizophyllum commune]
MSRQPNDKQSLSKKEAKKIRRDLEEANARLSDLSGPDQTQYREKLAQSQAAMSDWRRRTTVGRTLSSFNSRTAEDNRRAFGEAEDVAYQVLTRSEEARRNAQAASGLPAPPRTPTPPPAPPQQRQSSDIARHILPWRLMQQSADNEGGLVPRGAHTLPSTRDHRRAQPSLDYSFDPPRAPSGDYYRGGLAPPTRRVASSSQPEFGSQPPFRQTHRPQISAVGGRPASVRSSYGNAPSTTSSGSTGTLYVHSSDESHQSHRSPQPDHPQASGHSHPSHQSTHAGGTHASSSHGAGPSHASHGSSHRHSGTSRKSSGH